MKEQILNLSLTNLIEKIQLGEYSSVQVVKVFIEKIKKINPIINALVVERFEEAIQEAKDADKMLSQGKSKGRLHGVPITIKECLDLIGTPSTFGMQSRKDDYPKQNDPYVQRLIDEGAIIIGKTNVSQLLAFFEADNPLYGRTLNPLNHRFSCGGSSGGEAAIIASGGSLIGLGTDLGGSVRIPAAFCGVIGFKPSMQRFYDFSRLSPNHQWELIASVLGVFGKNVEDIALILDILDGIKNPFNKEISLSKLSNYKNIDVKKLKIAYYTHDGLIEPISPIVNDIKNLISELSEEGFDTIELPWKNFEQAEAFHTQINTIDGAKIFVDNIQKGEQLHPFIKTLVPLMRIPSHQIKWFGKVAGFFGQKQIKRLSQHFNDKDLTTLQKEYENYVNSFNQMIKEQEIDIIISPVNSFPAYLHNSSRNLGSGGTYTLIYNVLGYPAASFPLENIKEISKTYSKFSIDLTKIEGRKIERQTEGLKTAVQIAAPTWQDEKVLTFLTYLEHKKNRTP